MFFWFKKNTTVVDAFTSSSIVYEQYPIVKAARGVPEWWKRLPASTPKKGFEMIPEGTMKSCNGFTDLYSKGFILPLWTDVAVELSHIENVKIWKYQFADNTSIIQLHDYESFAGMVDPNLYQHFKIISPWVLSSKKETPFLMTQPVWTGGDSLCKYVNLPGVVEFKYQYSINVNTMWEYIPGQVRQVTLEAGMPLVHLIPLTEDRVEIRCHEISTEEFNKKHHPIVKFKGSHRERKLRLNSNEPSGCPFKLWH